MNCLCAAPPKLQYAAGKKVLCELLYNMYNCPVPKRRTPGTSRCDVEFRFVEFVALSGIFLPSTTMPKLQLFSDASMPLEHVQSYLLPLIDHLWHVYHSLLSLVQPCPQCPFSPVSLHFLADTCTLDANPVLYPVGKSSLCTL